MFGRRNVRQQTCHLSGATPESHRDERIGSVTKDNVKCGEVSYTLHLYDIGLARVGSLDHVL